MIIAGSSDIKDIVTSVGGGQINSVYAQNTKVWERDSLDIQYDYIHYDGIIEKPQDIINITAFSNNNYINNKTHSYFTYIIPADIEISGKYPGPVWVNMEMLDNVWNNTYYYLFLRVSARLDGPSAAYTYTIIDISDLEGGPANIGYFFTERSVNLSIPSTYIQQETQLNKLYSQYTEGSWKFRNFYYLDGTQSKQCSLRLIIYSRKK